MILGLVSGCAPPPVEAPYEPVTEVSELMLWVLEPASEVLWDSAGQIVTEEGVKDLAPTTERGWDRVRNQSALVAELGNLLMMPHFAQDRPDWIAMSRGLVRAGMRARRATEARDADELFESGAALYQACLSCHRVYWPDGPRR